MTKRTFKFLSYFEKLFLVLFYRKGWFERSLAYLYRMKDIEEYRRANYPLINMFHIYLNKSEYKASNLKLLARQYDFFFESPFFKHKLIKVVNAYFNFRTTRFLRYLTIRRIFFKRYSDVFDNFMFKTNKEFNVLILNFIFNVFLLKATKRLIIYDLDNWKDWYDYSFKKNITRRHKTEPKKKGYESGPKRRDREYKFNKLVYLVRQYKIRYMIFSRLLKKEFVFLFSWKFNFADFFRIKINKNFNKLLKSYYTVKFSESSISKYINPGNLKNYNFFYLRKNRIFNKGRYSRNRQLYRTGVYWCLWLNIIMVYGLYFIFYRFSFNFGYIWWGVLILAYSTIFSRIVKYNFYNPFYVLKEFFLLQRWYGYIMKTFIYNFDNYFKKHFFNVNIINYIYIYQNSKLALFYDYYYYYTSKLFFWWLKKKENMKIVYLWQGMKEIDKSFLRYKTVLHWIKEIYRMFTTW